jgi:hypothetical protein
MTNLRVPLLALSGFLGVFACVALLVLAFQVMGLADPKQALGMPDGSVRALIAIFLIVTLGMAALFLLGPQRYGQPSTSAVQTPAPKTQQDKTTAPATTSSAASSSLRLATMTHQTAPTGTEPNLSADQVPDKTGSVLQQAKDHKENTAALASANQDNGDLAKQFLTMLGGLVTTIVGFYFGSQTANSAATKGANAATEAIKMSRL